VKRTAYTSFWPSTATSRRLPVKWPHFRVNSGHLRSRDVISCHVTASSCELQHCRKWNAQYTRVFGLLQPLPGDLRSNDVADGSITVTWGHVTSFSVTWPLPPSYSLVGSETHSIREFSAFYTTFRWLQVKWRHFWVTSGHLRSRDVISCHVTAFSCEVQPCRKWNAVYASFRPSTATSRWLLVKWRHFCSLPVTSGHVTSFPVTGLPPPASYSFVGSETHSIREFSAFYSHFQVTLVKWRHFRLPKVMWRHFLIPECLLPWTTAL